MARPIGKRPLARTIQAVTHSPSDPRNALYPSLVGLTLGIVLGFTAGRAGGQGFPPDEARQRMALPPGLTAHLFAAEPMVRQPILVKCDDRGRLWVIQYLQYPNPAGLNRVRVDRYSRTVYDRIPEPPPRGPRGADRITILEDRDGDGRADVARDFLDGLNLATGLAFGHGGVYVLQVPYLLFYPDRDRDDVPDSDPEVLLTGFGMEDAQSFANHLTWGPDGWLYGVNGSTTTCRIRGIEFQQGVWRYHPLSREFELFCEGGGNLFGLTFDARGNLFYSSNGNFLFFHGVQGACYPKNYGKHGPLHHPHAYGTLDHVVYTGTFLGPTTGGTIYTGDTFPAPLHNSFVGGNFLGHSVSWWTVTPDGSTVQARLGGTLLDARDSWFGPTDLCQGPDGSMYVCDFYDQRTAHPDPDANWDRTNGRVYKIVAEGTASVTGLDLHRRTSGELVELLRHPQGWYAEQARAQLAARRDPAVVPRLRELALGTVEEGLALQYLWALYVSGGWDDAAAAQFLGHSAAYVRAWGVRLLGDARTVSGGLASQLAALAETDASVVVRAQLAATARRLPPSAGLPVAAALLDRNLDAADRNLPLLLWWAIEEHAVPAREKVLALAVRPGLWTNSLWAGVLRRLARRYAAEGTLAGHASCQRILDTVPEDQLEPVLGDVARGLDERARPLGGMGPGDLYQTFALPARVKAEPGQAPWDPLPEDFQRRVRGYWQAQPHQETRLRLALQAGLPEAASHLRTALTASDTPEPVRRMMLDVLAAHGREELIPAVLSLVDPRQTEAVQVAAVSAAGRFPGPEVTRRLLAAYPRLAPAAQSRLRDLVLGRAASAREFLELVRRGQIDPATVPLDQLRVVALHEDEALNALVRTYWGTVQPGTPEEKLAEIRRLSNDLRAASGDAARGRLLFQKHCSTCHRRNGEGGMVGPDLTTVSRDRDFLLTSLVDPSVVIRGQYLSYAIVTRTGQILTGLIAEQDAASLRLLDAKGQSQRIPRDEIEEMRELTTSLMPENLLQSLTPQELRDLFRFLTEGGA